MNGLISISRVIRWRILVIHSYTIGDWFSWVIYNYISDFSCMNCGSMIIMDDVIYMSHLMIFYIYKSIILDYIAGRYLLLIYNLTRLLLLNILHMILSWCSILSLGWWWEWSLISKKSLVKKTLIIIIHNTANISIKKFNIINDLFSVIKIRSTLVFL